MRELLDVNRDNGMFGSPSRATPKLIRKYLRYDESKHTGHSVYLWEGEADARAFFNDELMGDCRLKSSAGFNDPVRPPSPSYQVKTYVVSPAS